MEHKHLTDDEIQDFLDGNIPRGETDLRHHLERCEICTAALEQYKTVYVGLHKEPEFRLPKNFARSIVSKISPEHPIPSFFMSADIIPIVIGLVFALGAIFYFVDLKPVVEIIARISLPESAFKATFLTPVKNLLATLNGNVGLLLFAGVALLFVAIVDHIIGKLRHQKLSL